MNNPFKYSDTNKRYHTYDHYLKHRFGKKCAKIPLDGGFSCPNRDGTKGTGGCTYCSGRGSGDFTFSGKSISEQFSKMKEVMLGKWDDCVFIPYFQSFSGTYASLDRLKSLYEEALANEGVVGLAVATRADCITDEVLEYLRELNERTFLTIELGLQSAHDSTAERINRCHTYDEFLETYRRLEGIPRCVHIINGLPGEDHDMMIETAKKLAEIKPEFLKIHMLHILKGTAIEKEYLGGKISLLSKEEYVKTVCDQLEILPPETVIERVTGDGLKDDLVAPLWTVKKFTVMNEIDKEFARRDTFQGIGYKMK